MPKSVGFFVFFLVATTANASFFNYTRFANMFSFKDNELWKGIAEDCRKRVSFSCIQKNAYSYLDNAFLDKDNITILDGFVMRKNNLDYQYCDKRNENSVEGCGEDDDEVFEKSFAGKSMTPLKEITNALRNKVVGFMATRNYEITLPEFFFEGSNLKISPREIDERGALIRVDFGLPEVKNEGRIFKKIRKFIQSKLVMSFLALLLIIKILKFKFMFVIPFLFGIGTAKKLFLKLLLFFVPAFAHIFKLCSSYYSNHVKYHHHHHKIAHHHHHVPVPVPVPVYDYHPHHAPEEDFQGYDYAHPHIQYRKDMDELKEWGIEPNEEPPFEDTGPIFNVGPPNYGAHNLAYSGYAEKSDRRTPTVSIVSAVPGVRQSPSSAVVPGTPAVRPNPPINLVPTAAKPSQKIPFSSNRVTKTKIARQAQEDEFYGPILARLDEIFTQLNFEEESCKERLVCSMYKNPLRYSPHSNLVSNELSRNDTESKSRDSSSESSQRFHRFFEAARIGTFGGDCTETFPCHIKTE